VTVPDIDILYKRELIDATDWTFARTLQRLGQCDDPWVGLAAALVSRAAGGGHVCLDLETLQRQDVLGEAAEFLMVPSLDPDEWRARLTACAAVGEPGQFRPLILDGRRLYLHRYYTYEQALARAILDRCAAAAMPTDETRLAEALAVLFPEGATDQQKAARLAATHLFSVISGGPGTGKTYTVARIILLLQMLAPHRPLKIALAAPTGKAAARMQEAVATLLKSANGGQGGDAATVQEAQTLHRLLGYMPSEARFRYDAGHPLSADAVIVDEASMIDLALMHQLIQALPKQARLVLVGDKDQLASVEAGAVLGDICHGVSVSDRTTHGAVRAPLARHIAVLEQSHRFEARSGIGELSRAINAGDAPRVLALLADSRLPGIALRPLTDWEAMPAILEAEVAAALGPMFDHPEPGTAFARLNRFKILTAVRKGPYGVETMNQRVEQALRRQGRIPSMIHGASGWYPGRPVMITRNDYYHGLFNGDVGITLARPGSPANEMQVVFPGPQGTFKALAPHQLPEHETVYAMTIHKSQGSEFDCVMVVLPDADLPLLTRELIYTAVTRSRASIEIWADPNVLAMAVKRPIQRASGLRDALWSGDSR
jgi:exodeoxyribonuclease V alpha subunit